MQSLIEFLFYFFSTYTSIDPKKGIFAILWVILGYLIYIILKKGWQGWSRQQITIGNRKYGVETHSGKSAQRISAYYLGLGIFLIIYCILVFILDFNYSVEPFRLYRGNHCIWRCEK